MSYEFTKQKIVIERKAGVRRFGMVVGAALIGASFGFIWPDHDSAFGVLRILSLGGITALVALVIAI